MNRNMVLTGATGNVGGHLLNLLLSEIGASVITVGRRPSLTGSAVAHISADFCEAGSVRRACRRLQKYAAQTEAVFLAAGIDSFIGGVDFSAKTLSRCMKVNCIAQLEIVRALCLGRPAETPLKVLAISSDVVGHGQPNTLVYAVSKLCLEESLRHLTADLPAGALHVLILRLPFIGVPMSSHAEPDRKGKVSPIPSGCSLRKDVMNRTLLSARTFLENTQPHNLSLEIESI